MLLSQLSTKQCCKVNELQVIELHT